MIRKQKKPTDTPAESLIETPQDAKRKKFPFRVTVVSSLLSICVLLIVGISGYSLHSSIETNPSFCASCHNMESHVTSYQSSNHLDNVHAQANVTCKDCHSSYTLFDEAQSLIKYVTGDYDKIFSKRKFDSEMCLQCHIDLQFQAQQTSFLVRNPHESHYPDLQCGTCHVVHNNQVDYCARCHDNGGQRMIEEINTTSESQ